MKPGVQSTEFYVTIVTTIVAWLTAMGWTLHISSQTVQSIAAAASVLIPLAYTIGRTLLKGKLSPVTTSAPSVATLVNPYSTTTPAEAPPANVINVPVTPQPGT